MVRSIIVFVGKSKHKEEGKWICTYPDCDDSGFSDCIVFIIKKPIKL